MLFFALLCRGEVSAVCPVDILFLTSCSKASLYATSSLDVAEIGTFLQDVPASFLPPLGTRHIWTRPRDLTA